MIAVVVSDDGLHFRVMANDAATGEVVDVTELYEIRPMAYKNEDGKDVIGFHVGYVKDE
jgi:hypothetical protein